MASPALFTGVGVALVTLFDEDGEIDAPATADHATRLVEAGIRAVLVAGTTGEAATLDPDERSDLLLAVRYAVDGRVPVLAGTGSASTRQALELSKRAAADGADALLVHLPPGSVDPISHYERITSAVGIPGLAYPYPNTPLPGLSVPVPTHHPAPVA